jgi:membrane-associated phospholipid phosphatase
MKKIFTLWLSLTFSIGLFHPDLLAQVTKPEKGSVGDTLKKFEDPVNEPPQKNQFFKSKGFKATIVPAVLIGYGLSVIKDNGIYSSYELQSDIHRKYPNFHTSVDNYLIIAPFIELGLAYALQVKGNHDFLNTGILILKAEVLNNALIFGLKNTTKQERPDGSNSYSLPSGHTANAFLAASIIHNELRHRSQWYGIGAYTIATSVGALRILNNKHWESDVFTGAGIGILSAHLAYLSHRNRWGNKPSISMTPTYIYGTPGIGMTLDLNNFRNRKITHFRNSTVNKSLVLN